MAVLLLLANAVATLLVYAAWTGLVGRVLWRVWHAQRRLATAFGAFRAPGFKALVLTTVVFGAARQLLRDWLQAHGYTDGRSLASLPDE